MQTQCAETCSQRFIVCWILNDVVVSGLKFSSFAHRLFAV